MWEIIQIMRELWKFWNTVCGELTDESYKHHTRSKYREYPKTHTW